MSMQNVASSELEYTAPKRNQLTHIPGDEGWPIVGMTFKVLADPKGHIESERRQVRARLSHPHFRRDQHRAARA